MSTSLRYDGDVTCGLGYSPVPRQATLNAGLPQDAAHVAVLGREGWASE